MRNCSYKGFKCVNISKDSSFPYYAIISPKGEDIEHTLFPSDMKEIVDNYLKGESKNSYLNESINPLDRIQNLIQQANDAYHKASSVQDNDEYPLMDKKGNTYGLLDDVKIDGRGYVLIPLNDVYNVYTPVKIKVLTKRGGKIRILNGDYFEEGWKDAAKILKKIIKDAEIGMNYFREYDPSLESSESAEELKSNKSSLKALNKKIGRNSSAGMEYLSEGKLNSIISKTLRKVLRENISSKHGEHTFDN